MKKGGSRFTAASLTYTDKHNVPAALPELGLQDAHKCLQPGPVRLREAADAGTVDVQDADDLGACVNGDDNFGIGCAVTGYMARE